MAMPTLAPMATSWSGSGTGSTSASSILWATWAACFCLEIIDQNGELVAAETGDRVRIPQNPAESVGNTYQEGVTGQVAEAVVDVLEPVEVDDNDPDESALA